ncbi:MAG TPA: LPS-assembly protein LptD [Salinarimonas sp.]|nr:LPS-assembly protein LptD [Salinarimonas sp.]
MGRVAGIVAGLAVGTALSTAVVPVPASAQGTLNDSLTQRMKNDKGARLLLEARELVYDNDRNTVTARGDVEMNYQGRTLQADSVTYDRNTGRVTAEGNARLTETDGTVATGSRFELTDDFKSGFINELRVEQTTKYRGVDVRTRFSAPRAERIEGESTVFESGTYTACEPCAKDPTRPPLWQVKAARIIHNNSERTIYYENATLEFAGIPVAYMPYFWAPDPTVKRKTGLLSPTYVVSTALGTGVTLPIFINLAPNYDLTLRPTYLSRQGFLGQAEWRHRLETGSYSIRVTGISQAEPDAFLKAPVGAGDKTFRGAFETRGRFHINERWHFGWNVTAVTDKWFLQNYQIRNGDISNLYGTEAISTAYLTGQGERSWFDARGYYFVPLTTTDWQRFQPIVHPVLDYDKRVNGPAPLGGEVRLQANLTSLTRDAAHFQEVPSQVTRLFGIYDTCAVFERGSCIVRGIGGTTTRLSAQASWRRTFIDPAGQTWTPFAFARVDGFFVSPNTTQHVNYGIVNLLGQSDDTFTGRAMPGVGVEYRFPLVASAGGWGTHLVEPIVQVIARPSETRVGRLPNEDAQSLVFDDSNLFAWDKFSGWDRVEGGVRTNYGVQYTLSGPGGFNINALFGQSVNVAGRNSFGSPDIVNVGLDSGLEDRFSDYVGRLLVQPWTGMSLQTRARFDKDTFALNRFEASFQGGVGALRAGLTYARYAAQPGLGYSDRREGVAANARLALTPNWYLSGSVTVDLDHMMRNRATAYTPAGLREPTISAMTLGGGYADECTVFEIVYSQQPRTYTGAKETTQTIMFKLDLRTLGQAGVSQNLGGTSSAGEGIAQ